ncbi:C2H2 type zinc finger domain-containing protein [Paraphaeosphaeria minitans]|uniref:C2H2 type zinc finger domain-containing protein n=1 Tax=Paraphaeosphaeria minitans TaxID=565426 RepID=A0A9P6GI09_9PLEO|nr:C2H2 type zinc finger domain-containing protein [Paraphaeosphaeria minitans]
MKTWLHVHGLRKQHSDAALSTKNDYSSATRNARFDQLLPNRVLTDTAARNAAAKSASRMSIERYLQAPLEDEPASVPAINAALKENSSPVWIEHDLSRRIHHRGHSRDTSYDANSEGRRTFYTSASGQESTGSSFSFGPRSNNHQRSNLHLAMPPLPRLRTAALVRDDVHSPDELNTGKTLDSGWALTDQHETSPQGKSADSAYRARIEAELARIQEKARSLEEEVRRFDQRKENEELLVPRITDEMAHQQMALKPKLAWILGGDSTNKPMTSTSITADTLNDGPSRPATSGRSIDSMPEKIPRRSKSSSAILEESQWASDRRRGVMMGRTPSKRPKLFCTFCQKKFHNGAEWVGHEKNFHMPEELWNTLLSERTFDRKDYFLQHVAQQHNVSAGQKPLRLTQLVEDWRRPLLLRHGHQALHCGFCGLTFPTYSERTEHVTGHFMRGTDIVSWWSERKSHHVPPPAKGGQNDNPFLPGMQYTIYPSGSNEGLEAVCCYCNEGFSRGNGKVEGALLKAHVSTHNFRNCNQRLYFSAQQFRQHLQDNHRSNYDGTLFAGWTLLLKASQKELSAIFVPADVSPKRAYTEPVDVVPNHQVKKAKDAPEPKMSFMDFSETPRFATKEKIRRRASTQTMADARNPNKAVRDSTTEFRRAATMDFARGDDGSAGAAPICQHRRSGDSKAEHAADAAAAAAAASGLQFFRRRREVSTRNRLYVRNETEGPLAKSSQKVFRKMAASTFGGLVLHSSLLAATPARLTNSVDVYTLH